MGRKKKSGWDEVKAEAPTKGKDVAHVMKGPQMQLVAKLGRLTPGGDYGFERIKGKDLDELMESVYQVLKSNTHQDGLREVVIHYQKATL